MTASQVSHGQQLMGRIKRTSKYWGQTAPNEWFEVRVVDDAAYRVRGNDNNYRLADIAFGMRLAGGTIVDLTNGKTSASAKAGPQKCRSAS